MTNEAPRTRACGTVVAALLLLAPPPAHAQHDRYAQLSFAATQTYESNLFAAPSSRDPQRDLLLQFGPTLEVGQRSRALEMVARYGLAAERYVDQVTLNRSIARQDAAVELHHHASRRIELDAKASYVDTHSPRELNLDSGIAVGRAHAKRFASSSEITYAWTRSARLAFDYAFTNDALVGGERTRIHNAGVGLERQSTARGAHRIDYRIRQVGFNDRRPEIWHVATLGWSRPVTRLTTFDVAVGPRLSNGTLRPDISASLTNRFQRGELSASFASTRATAVGEGGAFEMRRVAFGLVRHVRRDMTLAARPAFMVGSRGPLGRVSVYAVDLEAAAHPKPGLAVVAAGNLGWQTGLLDGRQERIPYRRLSLGLVVTVPRAAGAARAR
jgi:hypothetical protein